MTQTSDRMLQDPRLLRLVLRLGLPAMLGLSANAINQFIDAVWITKLSPTAMAAVGQTFPILLVLSAFSAGIGVAASAEVGRRMGRNDTAGAEKVAATAFVANVVVAVGLAALIGWSLPWSLSAVGATAETAPLAQQYLRVILFAVPIGASQIIADFVALGAGHSRRSMMTLVLCFGLNIVLDPLLIFVFDWGLTGAALATVCGQISALSVYLVWFRRGTLDLRPQRQRPAWATIRTLVKFAPPVVILNLLTAVSFLFLLKQAARLADETFIAGFSFDLRLVSLVMIPIQGLALGAQAAVAQAFGAGLLLRCQAVIRCIFLLSVGIGTAALSGMLLFQEQMFALLIEPEYMRQTAQEVFPYFAVYVWGSCCYIPLLMAFQATERAVAAAVVALAPSGYAMLPLCYVLPKYWDLQGLLWVVPLSGVITASLACALHFAPTLRSRGKPAYTAPDLL